MSFELSTAKIEDIVQRRFVNTDPATRHSFPSVLTTSPVRWVSFGNDKVFALFFLSADQLKRAEQNSKQLLDPFPGLITTDDGVPAAFRIAKSKFNMIRGATITGRISFSFGADGSIVLVNHTQRIETQQLGLVEYTIPLAYLLSFGEEITNENAYERLDELVAYSVSQWSRRK